MTRPDDVAALRRDLADLAATSPTVEERAEAVLTRLGETLAFDAGWLALRDPERRLHRPVATIGAAEPLRAYFARPEADEEVEWLGLNGPRPPMLASEIPLPLSEVAAWADHLLPAGFRNAVAAGLFTSGGRHVGFLSLTCADGNRPTPADRSVIAAVTTSIADNLDRTRDIAETARFVGAATAGAVISRAGDVLPLPGLPPSRLLARGSPVVSVGTDELAAGAVPFATFRCPTPGAAERFCRVVALDLARPDLDHLRAAILLGPPGDLRGLSPTELRLLGLVVDGVDGTTALARALRLSPRAAVAARERSFAALGARDATAAGVLALRTGLRVPPALGAA